MTTLERPAAQPDDDHKRRVVVGVDGSLSSLRALRWAAAYADRLHADLDVVAVWQLPTTYGWALHPSAEGHPARHARHLLDDELLAAFGADVPANVRRRVVEGHPSAALVQAAHGADLLVVGSRRLGVLTSALTGSVGAECAHHATCPVAIIRD